MHDRMFDEQSLDRRAHLISIYGRFSKPTWRQITRYSKSELSLLLLLNTVCILTAPILGLLLIAQAVLLLRSGDKTGLVAVVLGVVVFGASPYVFRETLRLAWFYRHRQPEE